MNQGEPAATGMKSPPLSKLDSKSSPELDEVIAGPRLHPYRVSSDESLSDHDEVYVGSRDDRDKPPTLSPPTSTIGPTTPRSPTVLLAPLSLYRFPPPPSPSSHISIESARTWEATTADSSESEAILLDSPLQAVSFASDVFDPEEEDEAEDSGRSSNNLSNPRLMTIPPRLYSHFSDATTTSNTGTSSPVYSAFAFESSRGRLSSTLGLLEFENDNVDAAVQTEGSSMRSIGTQTERMYKDRGVHCTNEA